MKNLFKFAVVLLLGSCESFGYNSPSDTLKTTFNFYNLSSGDIHMFVDGYENFNEGNKLSTGATRTKELVLDRDEFKGSFKVNVGSNGNVIKFKTIDPGDVTYTGVRDRLGLVRIDVSWDGNEITHEVMK